MDYMATVDDNAFDIAIVDPPYGIKIDKKNNNPNKISKKSFCKSNEYGNQIWDNEIPSLEYFSLLKRISKKQIIWGANYFGLKGGMLFWKKNVTMPTYSSGEIAYLSWKNANDFYELTWHGMLQEDMSNKETRIHPTQKPVKLYQWLLTNYAKPGQRVLDTHLGSGSSAIAAYYYGCDFVGCEKDKDYFDAMQVRFDNETRQKTLNM